MFNDRKSSASSAFGTGSVAQRDSVQQVSLQRSPDRMQKGSDASQSKRCISSHHSTLVASRQSQPYDQFVEHVDQQDSQRCRPRPSSSILDPLKRKLGKSSSQPVSVISYDSSLPPFNSANVDGLDQEEFILKPRTPSTEILPMPKQRNVSDSFKNKFRRMLKLDKRSQTTFPAQHVPSKQFHFNVYTPADETGNFDFGPPQRAPPTPPGDQHNNSIADHRQYSNQSSDDSRGSQGERSRVTSWTDSTVDGNTRGSVVQKRLSSIDELPSRQRQATSSDHEKGSLLGRKIRLASRKHGQTEVGRSSEDSQKLYEALSQEILHGGHQDRTSLDVAVCGESVPREPVSFDKVNKELTYDNGYAALSQSPTIRTVTPESPVKSIPTAGSKEVQKTIPAETSNDLYSDPDLRARRLQKAQNRWQQTLKNESPITSRALRASEETDPYRLGSLPTSPQSAYLPMSVRHGRDNEDPFARHKSTDSREQERFTISPSVYSREPGATSTRSNSPIPNIGTVITVTGREVKRYSLDSPSKVQLKPSQVRASHE